VGPFQELWSGELLRIKDIAEKDGPVGKQAPSRKRKKRRQPSQQRG
jgi:hypothetical protein